MCEKCGGPLIAAPDGTGPVDMGIFRAGQVVINPWWCWRCFQERTQAAMHKLTGGAK